MLDSIMGVFILNAPVFSARLPGPFDFSERDGSLMTRLENCGSPMLSLCSPGYKTFVTDEFNVREKQGGRDMLSYLGS